jgi:PKD repeat protein
MQGGGFMTTVSDSMNPTLVFPNAGSYEVCLTVDDGQGCTDMFCAPITVVDNSGGGDSCMASFVYSVLPSDSGLVIFSADMSNNANQYVWDFGDGNSGGGSTTSHSYGLNESWYWACLTVYGPNGCQDSYCDTIALNGGNGGGCTAGFSNSGMTPIGYTFSAYNSDPSASYAWSIDNVENQGSGAALYVPGFVDGAHNICLTVSAGNCTDTQCMTIYVSQDSCFGWLSGQVFAGNVNQPIDVAEVFLISFDANTNQLTEVQSTMIDSGGFYYFPMVPCGEYLVKAATTPNSAFYNDQLPTYYGNSTFWNYAQELVVTEVMPAVQYDITLITGSNPGGPGFVGGNVTEGANKLADEGDPLVGITVMLFDMGGNAIGYTYTDVNGAFGFDNLAYGTYQVYTEFINYTTVPAVVTIGENAPSVDDIQIVVADELISTGVAEVNFDALVSGVYPSPMANNGSLTVNFEQNYTVTISIVDLAGRVITSESRVLPVGKSNVAVAAAGLSEGYYMLTMTELAGAFSITRKFAVAH